MYHRTYHIYPKYWDTLTLYSTCPKTGEGLSIILLLADRWQTVKALIRCRILRHLIWVYTVCSGLSVLIFITVAYNLHQE